MKLTTNFHQAKRLRITGTVFSVPYNVYGDKFILILHTGKIMMSNGEHPVINLEGRIPNIAADTACLIKIPLRASSLKL